MSEVDKTPTQPASNQQGLTIPEISAINYMRCRRWHQGGIDSWSLSDWSTALAGEVGELCNVVKKLNRIRDGLVGNKETPEQLHVALGKEIADVFFYLDLVARRAEVDLEDALIAKFNEVSERNGFPERLAHPMSGASAPETTAFRCKANRTADPPQDCDWPHCGCDPKADKVLEALSEEGVLDDAARYRFLRQPGNAIVYAKDRNCWGEGASGHVKYDTAEKLDAAVDAARSAEKASGPRLGDPHPPSCACWECCK